MTDANFTPPSTNRLGRDFVTAELYRRGVQEVGTVSRGKRKFLIVRANGQGSAFEIYVKTRLRGTWQAATDDGASSKQPSSERKFWILVDIRQELDHPEYFIIPEWWIRNNIFEVHQAYLARHGGQSVTDHSKTGR